MRGPAWVSARQKRSPLLCLLLAQDPENVYYYNQVPDYLPKIYVCLFPPKGFPGGSLVKNLPANTEMQEMHVSSLGIEDSLEEGMTSCSGILA